MIPLNHEEIVVAIGIMINPTCEKKVKLIIIFKITEINENLNGVLVSFLANKKVENILIKENAGSPNEKQNNAFAELLTLTLSKEPYPNKADVICSEPTISANDAGKLKNKLSSNALF